MTCESWQELVLEREYLNEVQRRNLDQHLSNCSYCRAWEKALAEVEAVVTDQLLAQMDPLAFPGAALSLTVKVPLVKQLLHFEIFQ